MKCPKCGSPTHIKLVSGLFAYCERCDLEPKPIDGVELRGLIEKAKVNVQETFTDSPRFKLEVLITILDTVKSYLDGDPEPLRKLTGEKE